MTKHLTKDIQYSYLFEEKEEIPGSTLGPMMKSVWNRDPKRLLFVLSRYKFVSKMLSGKKDVLEIGCGDGWASRIVRQNVKNLTLSDYDPMFVSHVKSQNCLQWKVKCLVLDLTKEHSKLKYDAIYMIDVFEHISPLKEDNFLKNLIKSINQAGTVIIGVPSLESQALIPIESRDPGHINCKTGNELSTTLQRYFKNVFIFSMNDEIIHTGHNKMAHYLFAICCNPIKE
tara:strand:+ start:486 stop:1172 length:687 start_codon:yes stop_codon:yes gene_type:complete